jgi:hypothetical protein
VDASGVARYEDRGVGQWPAAYRIQPLGADGAPLGPAIGVAVEPCVQTVPASRDLASLLLTLCALLAGAVLLPDRMQSRDRSGRAGRR